MRKYSKETFVNNLSDINWMQMEMCENVDEAWALFKLHFLSVLDVLAPLKEVRIKQRTKPWINSEILDLIRNRDNSLTKFRRSKIEHDYNQYLLFRNQVNYKKAEAKADYFVNVVNDNKNQPKKLWQALKDLGTSSKCVTKSNMIGLKINCDVCLDKSLIAEHFNVFFSNIAHKLVKNLPVSTGMFGMDFATDYYKRLNVTNNSFKLKHVNVELVTAILSGMNSNKATGLYNLPARFIKDGASVIAGPMTHIINVSLGVGRVPVDIKMAKVVPLHKKNSKTEVGNYRPVSILNSMSKVIERIVFSQLNEYLVNNKLLYEFQSGFRSNYSSDTCLIHLCDFIRQECDQGKYTGMVTLDLQKAFDTVNHAILLAKMKALGMTTDAVNWFSLICLIINRL